MRSAYYGGTELTGAGQIVGLVEFDGFSQSDVDLTFTSAGQFYSVSVEKVLVADATGIACQFMYPCSDAEQVLDIVQAIGMAPGLSQVRVYIGGGDTEILNSIAEENLAKEVSISWTWTPDDPTTDDPFFKEFSAQGQSVFVATGDSGSYISSDSVYPAESTYVTAVGATDLVTTGPAGSWSSETAWSQSGGGISPDSIAIPSWQAGVANASNGASLTYRNLPDVAMEGNTDNYYCAQGSCTGSAGGTSFAAPRWAGFMALVNEQGQNAGDPLVGFLNPALYPLAEGSNSSSVLHDITSGSNDYTGTCNGAAYCHATVGYDLVTGWGSPAGQPLIDALAPPPVKKSFELSSSANSLTITPGNSAGATITVVGQGGFSGSVSFSVTGLPSGITAVWSANPAASGSQLTFTAGPSAMRGSYRIIVTGTSGTLAASTLIVVGVNAPGFAIYPVPGNLAIFQGTEIETSIQVEYLDGFSGAVNFGITSPLPTGVTAVWQQNPSTSASLLTLSVSGTAAVGATTLAITGTSGGLIATTTISLNVEAPSVWLLPSPGFLPIYQGGTTTSTIFVLPQGTPHGPYSLSTQSLPAGVSVTFNPSTVNVGETSQMTVTADATTPPGLDGVTILGSPQVLGDQYEFSGVGLIVTALPQPTASVSVSSPYVRLMQGTSATVTINVNSLNGFTGTESFRVVPPAGVTATFSQNPSSASSILTLTASGTAKPGVWNLGFDHQASNAINSANYIDDFFVEVQPAASYSLSNSASPLAVTPGGSASTTITVNPQPGFTGNVQLAVISNLPSGTSATFNPNPASQSSVLTVSANNSVAPGAYPIEVAGTSGSQTVTDYFSLSIEIPTTTTLTVTPPSITQPSEKSYILAATVLTGSSQPAHGQVSFCNADAASCTGLNLLGTAQLTKSGTALLRFSPSVGTHNYKAVFSEEPNGTTPYTASSSAPVNLTVKGSTTTTLKTAGSPGNYTLTAAVSAAGGAAPSGSVTFADNSLGTITPSTADLVSETQNINFTGLSFPSSIGSLNAIATGDFNGDGIPDLAVSSVTNNDIIIFLGNGDGTFKQMPGTVPAGSGPYSIAVGDYNGDGNADLAIADMTSNSVLILLGNGDGTFSAGTSTGINGSEPWYLISADFNRDGNPDLAVINIGSSSITILLGAGDGTFTAKSGNIPTGSFPQSLVAGDFNGDGNPDIAVVNFNDSTVSIFLGNGDGTFQSGRNYATGSLPNSIAAADLNKDGKLDLVITNYGDNSISILLGNGDGTFNVKTSLAGSLVSPLQVAVADFNQDGIPDLAITNYSSSTSSEDTLQIYLGIGDGSFSTTPISTSTGGYSEPLVVADLNQDGIPDAIYPKYASINVQLTQLNTTATASASGVGVTGTGSQTITANYPGDSNYSSSQSSGVTLSADQQAATPSFTPLGGVYAGSQTVTISTTTPNATIYYTTNNTTPTTSSSVYGSSITVGSSETLKAVAIAVGFSQSAVATAVYTIKATPTITWATPAAITYGTALSATQLNASAGGIAGTLAYTPALGTVLSAGTQTLSVTFSPTDTTDYSSVTQTVALQVNKATLTVTASSPVVDFGSPIPTIAPSYSGFQNGDNASVVTAAPVCSTAYTTTSAVNSSPSTSCSGGTVSTNYLFSYVGGTVTIVKDTPLIAWTTPSAITYGTALSATQLNATAAVGGSSVAGTFTYTPALGTVLKAGSRQTLSVTFAPTDTTDYATSAATTTITVNQVTPVIAWATPSAITYGTALSATQLNATAAVGGSSVAGTFTYTPALGTVLKAGSRQTLSVTFAPTDTTDYATSAATTTITVNQVTPVIAWATPAAITYGTALSATQLNASAGGIAGTFAYSPATGAIPAVGNDNLSVIFSPTDATDYTSATASVTLVVNSPPNPVPAIGSMSPAFTSASGAAFTLNITGTGFVSGSTAYWGTTALSTTFASATELTAQVTAAEIASAGITTITVQSPAPGGGTSNTLQFEVDTAGTGSGTAPTFTSLTASVAPGSTATYAVTLPSSATNVLASCLNLPSGATCTYSSSSGAVTIATSASTPAGSYQVIVVFTETLPGAASSFVLLPLLLLPLLFIRQRMVSRGIWFTACLGFFLLAGAMAAVGCGGGGSGGSSPITPTNPTHQVSSSGSVTLTIQ